MGRRKKAEGCCFKVMKKDGRMMTRATPRGAGPYPLFKKEVSRKANWGRMKRNFRGGNLHPECWREGERKTLTWKKKTCERR